jgi:putrescine aminotransferase
MSAGSGGPAGQPVMWNPFANMASFADRALEIVRGEGAVVFDASGRGYLDALASLWYCNVGHGRAELADAAADQMRRLAAYQVFDSYTNPPAEALARRLAALAPQPGAKVFFTPGGGSDAIDTAAKLTRAYWRAAGQPGRQVIIARARAYHGMNAYGTTLGGIPANAEQFGPLVSAVEHVPWDDAEALDKLIGQLGRNRVGAFFCEPVVGAGGVYPPPDGYLARVQEICRQHDVLFVADEVITGFGRLGAWLGSGRFGLEPDLITTAKGLTSGYAPLGAVIASQRVSEPFWRPGSAEIFRHGYTYSAHPTACAVGLGEPGPDRARAAGRPGGGARARTGRGAAAAGGAPAGQRGQGGYRAARRGGHHGPGMGRRSGHRRPAGGRGQEPGSDHPTGRRDRAPGVPAVRDHAGSDRPDRRGLRRRPGRGGQPLVSSLGGFSAAGMP